MNNSNSSIRSGNVVANCQSKICFDSNNASTLAGFDSAKSHKMSSKRARRIPSKVSRDGVMHSVEQNSKDPIYYVFDVIENRPIKTLAKEFVKDSFFEITNFVSKVVR